MTVTGQMVEPETPGKPREKAKRPEEARERNGFMTPYCDALGPYKVLKGLITRPHAFCLQV